MDVSNPCAKADIPQLLGRTLTIGEKRQLGTFDSFAGKDEAEKQTHRTRKQYKLRPLIQYLEKPPAHFCKD